jgi:hypothetical protein
MGNPADNTKIGLRVNNNIMAGGFLSISDRRIKDHLTPASIQSHLDIVSRMPIYTYSLRSAPNASPITGFIAQEVEDLVPAAVKTTVAPIPSILQHPFAITDDGYKLHLLPNHGISEGSILKILVGDQDEKIVQVTFASDDTITVDKPLPASTTPSEVLIYGEVVSDFKLLDSERLVPFVFGAVKELHSLVTSQQKVIDDILARLAKLEK